MSKLDLINIQGIRNFGIEESQKLKFYTPITLIVGKNGCGKTTLIECLKYMTTGEYPPNSGRGSYFVHDPKIAKETAVRARVQLQFRSTRGERVVGNRVVEATQKQKKLECKSIDATIKLRRNGQDIELSSKCADIQAEITSLLGVAKPILENVIFCHQEDSSWPLDEGKKVKDRFDAIFNATRYIKCLDAIRKLGQEKGKESKQMAETVKALATSKNIVKGIRKELQNREDDQLKVQDDQNKIQEELLPIKERIVEIDKVIAEWSKLNMQLVKLNEKVSGLMQQQLELKESQVESLDCSDIELNRMINEFESNLKEKEKEQSRISRNKSSVEVDLKSANVKYLKVSQTMGSLEYVHGQHLVNIVKKDKLVVTLAKKYDMVRFFDANTFTIDQTEEVLDKLNEITQSLKQDVTVSKRECDTKSEDYQTKLDLLRQEHTTLKTSISSCKTRLSATTTEISTATKKLRVCENDLQNSNVDEIKEEMEEEKKKIEEEEKRVNVDELKGDNRRRREEDAKLQTELKELRSKILTLTRQSDIRSQYDFQSNEKKETEKKVGLLLRKIEDELKVLFTKPDYNNLRHTFDATMANCQAGISEKNSAKEDLTKMKTEHTLNLKNKRDTLRKKEVEIKENENQLVQICHGVDFEAAFDKSKKVKDSLQKDFADINSSKSVLARYVEKLEVEDPACPLCHRDFERKNDVTELVTELNGKMRNLPSRLSSIKSKLSDQEKNHERLIQTKPQIELTRKLKAEVELLKDEIKSEQSGLEGVEKALEDCMESLDILQGDEMMGNRIRSDVINIDSFKKKIISLEEKIATIQADLGSFDESMDMEGLSKKQTKIEEVRTKNLDEISSNMEKIQEHQNRLQKSKDKLLKLSQKELALKTKQQESEKLKEEIVRLKDTKKELDTEIEEGNQKVAPLPYNIKSIDDEFKKAKKEMEKSLEKLKEIVTTIEQHYKNLADIHESISKYVRENCEAELTKTRENCEKLKETIREKETKIKELAEELNGMQEEIINQKENKRNLTTEKTIREKEREIEGIRSNVKNLEEKIGKYGQEKLQEEFDDLSRKRNRKNAEMFKLDGKSEELTAQKKSLQQKLNTPDMKNAEINYMKKFIKKKCIEIAISDLDKYYRALDQSINKFHKEKMNTINSIIRELWRTTYKGNDIDTIEIMTSDGESGGLDKRRVFNYRVVMFKNGVEMDMRGRCSAGQKVLAALIIRMALAETFSSNCGILALDEPTTNLDEDNIIALAEALAAIVERRAGQRNFQLIVISHDKPFLERLGRASGENRFHIVERDDRGLSVLRTATDWDMVYA